jgi:hypothetical protein
VSQIVFTVIDVPIARALKSAIRWAIDLSPGGLRLPTRRTRLANFIVRMVTRKGVEGRARLDRGGGLCYLVYIWKGVTTEY